MSIIMIAVIMYIFTFTGGRSFRPGFIKLTNTLLGPLQKVSSPASEYTTGIVLEIS